MAICKWIAIVSLFLALRPSASFGEDILYPIQVGKAYGFADVDGHIRVPPSYSAVGDYSEGLAAVAVEGRWGYIDIRGNKVVSPQYESAGAFHEGLAPVQRENQYGFIDKGGKEVISLRYQRAREFSSGLAAVRYNGRWGYVKKDGHWRLEPQYLSAGNFMEGLAPVSDGTKWGYVDQNGEKKIAFQFEDAKPFSEGLAAVRTGKPGTATAGYIDAAGRFAIPDRLEWAESFSHGLAPAEIAGGWGYLDKTGKYVVPPIYCKAERFNGELAFVIDPFERSQYVDARGHVRFRRSDETELGLAGIEFTRCKLESRPRGAEVFLVPIYVFDNNPGILKDPNSMVKLKVPEGNTPVTARVMTRVYMAVFRLNGVEKMVKIDVVSDQANDALVEF